MTEEEEGRLMRIREVFDLVMEQEPETRRPFLHAIAGYDPPDIRHAVIALLEAEISTALAPESSDDPPDLRFLGRSGQRIGAYEIVRHIANGRAAAVYEAVRADEPDAKPVALTLLHHRLESRQVPERFRVATQAMARIEQRGIAALLDGDVADDGRPFLVTEFVSGIPITRWCDEHSATVEQRLAIFEQVCAAVQCAHDALLASLDLESDSILVTEDGTAKLLDLGLAELVTEEGENAPAAKSQRSADVYALGCLLFQLLSGKRQSPRSSLRPSENVAANAAVRSGTRTIVRLRERLRGDLDAITMMALRSESEPRYQSAEALRADVARHLRRLPVHARSGAGYHFDRFVRRNLVSVGVAAGMVLALVIVMTDAGLAAWQARDGRVQVNLAAAETAIGYRFQSQGRFWEAQRHFRTAESLLRRTTGDRSIPVVQAMSNVAVSLLSRGNLDSAQLILDRALALKRSISSNPDTLLAAITGSLGNVARGRGQAREAEQLYRESLRILRLAGGARDDRLAASMNNLALALAAQGRWAEAEAVHREAIAILRENHPGMHTLIAEAEESLGTALEMQGKSSAAESSYVSALSARRRLHGTGHPDYAGTLLRYSLLLADNGRCAESLELSHEFLALRAARAPASHPSVSASLQSMGNCLDKLGRHVEAGRALEESLELRRIQFGPDHWMVADAESVLGGHFTIVGRYTDAEVRLLRADRTLTEKLGPGDPATKANAQRLAALYASLGEKSMAASFRAKSVTK